MNCGFAQVGAAEETCDAQTGEWLVSLAFWLCLVAAACLYALVALAPRYLAWRRLDSEHYANRVRLVALEHEVERLARIGDALAHEPAYAAERARIDFRAAVHAAEQIPVEPSLQLRDRATASRRVRSTVHEPRAALLLEPFAWHGDVRRGTLAAAALLAVFAFACLHDGHAEEARALRTGIGRILARYRRRPAG